MDGLEPRPRGCVPCRGCPAHDRAQFLFLTRSVSPPSRVDSAPARSSNEQEALEPTSSATTVRVRNGKTLTTDGPFAETKEQLGGFLLIEAKDLDEAVRIAAGFPAPRYGSVEVRPILPTPPPE